MLRLLACARAPPSSLFSVHAALRCSSSSPLVVTEAAAARLRALAAARPAGAGAVLRVEVHEGGCRGLEYRFSLQTGAGVGAGAAATPDDASSDAPPDVRIDVDAGAGAAVVLDGSSLELMRGATVDWVTSLQGEMFTVAANPQAAAACGCGTSFARAEEG